MSDNISVDFTTTTIECELVTPTVSNPEWANIQNKPSTFTPSTHTHTVSAITDFPSLATVATSGSYNDLSNKPTIPAAQIQSDWNQSNNASLDFIKNKPSIPAAQIQSDWNQADTGALDYIKNKPTSFSTPATKTIGTTGSGADYICDGTADDVQFAQAVTAATAGDTLKVLAGTYNFVAAVAVNKSLNIEGLDRAQCKIYITGDYAIFNVTASGTYIKFLGLYVASQTTPTPLVILASSACRIDDCYFYGDYGIAIRSSYNQIMRCAFDVVTITTGIAINYDTFTAPAEYTRITNNVFGLSNYVGKALAITTNSTGAGLIFSENYILANYGIYAQSYVLSDVKIHANTFVCSNTPIYLECVAPVNVNYYVKEVCILGNKISGGVATYMVLKGIQDSIITDNICNGATANFIAFSSGSGGQPSLNNIVTNNRGAGTPSGGITEVDSNQDYNIYENNKCGTVTIAGTHSESRDKYSYASSPDGSRWQISTANDGTFTSTKIY